MGPYATEAEARQAIEHARENTERWDDEDREWDAKGATPGGTTRTRRTDRAVRFSNQFSNCARPREGA